VVLGDRPAQLRQDARPRTATGLPPHDIAAEEAVIAALYRDGGLEVARRFIREAWQPQIARISAKPVEPKTALQEWAQGRGKPLPVYGDGLNVRDWLYVRDHCRAIMRVLEAGRLGETYNIGGKNEIKNIDVVTTICALLDELRPKAGGRYADQITYVKDRPGHDRRYAIDPRKIEADLGWTPAETFATGFRKTVQWYLDHPDWIAHVRDGSYRDWIATQYAQGSAR